MKERSGTVAHADHASAPLLFDHLRIEHRGLHEAQALLSETTFDRYPTVTSEASYT